MGEAAAAAQGAVLHRRVEFHAAATRQPHAAVTAKGAGGFRVETLYQQGADKRLAAAAARSEGREKGEASGSGAGFDPELAAARVYLRRIGAGLRNLGNTCYLNSVLQCLTYTEPFVAYLHSGKHKSSCRTLGFCALCALDNHVRRALQSTGKIVTPMQFVKNLRCISRSFRDYRQEDAHELMVNLLESMHKSCLPSGIPSQSPSAYEKSLVHRIFGGRLRSQVRCANCSHCSSKFDPFLDLSLEIADASTLMKALQNFTKEEVLDGGEKQYNCQSCKTKVVAKKRFMIDKAPDVLTIHLKRFSPFNPREKIDKKVDFQSTLNLTPFVSNSEGMDFRYSLYGVLVHAGWNTQSGHYYCFVRTSSGIWHNLDDNQVRQVREADVLRQKAYMLFYVRDRVRSTVMFKDGASNFLGKNIIPEKIACMNDTIRNSLMEATLNVPSFINGDVKSQKPNSDNGHPTIFCNSSQGQCSKSPSSTEAMEAAAVQNNDMISAQKALCIQSDALVSVNTNDTTSDSQREVISPPHLFGQSTLDMSKVAASAQEVKTKDTNVPDGTMPSAEGLTCCGEAKELAESLKQHDEIVMDKELSTEHTDTVANIVEQTSVQTDTSEVGQVMLKEPSVKDIDHIANANELAYVQNNNLEAVQINSENYISSEKSAQVICSEVSAQVICSEVSTQAICSEDSAQAICSEISAQAICSEDSTKVFDKVSCHGTLNTTTDLKSKKHVAYLTAHLLFSSKLPLLAALKHHKRRKHKRAKIRSIDNDEFVPDDQQTSTSETVLTKDVSCKPHRRRKRSHAPASSDTGDKMDSKKPHFAEDSSSAADLPMDKKDGKDAAPASVELPSARICSVEDQTDSRNCARPNEGVSRHFDLLTRGLREIKAQLWDDADVPKTKATEFPDARRTNSIGYVPDQWDEEYDRGKRKKVRKPKEDDFGGPNPFQEATDIRSRQRKRLKSDQGRWGNQPRRMI